MFLILGDLFPVSFTPRWYDRETSEGLKEGGD